MLSLQMAMAARGGVGGYVSDLATAETLRSERLLTASLRFEPSFKHEEVDDPDFNPESYVRGSDTKKARKVANFRFDALLPLPMSCDEARLALALGRIAIDTGDVRWVAPPRPPPPDAEEDDRLAVLREMHALGWTVVDGLKFGVDFLAYAGDPLRTHADLMVLLRPLVGADAVPMLDATLLTTVAAKTRKSLVIASKGPGGVVFTRLHREPVNLPRFPGRGAPTEEDRLLDEVPASAAEIKVEAPL